MGKFIDLKGQRFGKLTVLERDFNGKKQVYWKCICDCGNVKSIRAGHLCGNKILSCGCHAKEVSAKAKIKRNNIEICDNYALIYLFNCDKVAIIDSEDVEKVRDYCWALNHYGYASTHITISKRALIHRVIMGIDNPKTVIDHINHNKLDNRKCNLRILDNNTTNLHNLDPKKSKSNTGFHNIYLTKKGKYYVSYKRYGKKFNVGSFNDLETAKLELKKSIEKNGFVHGGFNK